MRISFAKIIVVLALLLPSVSVAGTSPWQIVDGGKVRLVGLPASGGMPARAALEIVLEPGWKTYWRNPGGAGLPPQLDYSNSRNLEVIGLKFPAPQFFSEDSSIGYKDRVIFPMELRQPLPTMRSVLAMNGLLGICAEVCIPTPIDLRLDLNAQSGSAMEAVLVLDEARRKLPGAPNDAFRIEDARLSSDGRSVRVSAVIPEGATDVALFVEGPPSWYLIRGHKTGRNGGRATFEIPLTDVPEKTDPIGQKLLFTLVADDRAIEQSFAVKPHQN